MECLCHKGPARTLLVMKKFLLFAIIALGLGALTSQRAEAQNYPLRVLSHCQVCHQNVYASYRPVSHCGVVRYTWVPHYHTACAARHTAARHTAARHTTSYITKYHRGTPYNYAIPRYPVYYNRGFHQWMQHRTCPSTRRLREPRIFNPDRSVNEAKPPGISKAR